MLYRELKWEILDSHKRLRWAFLLYYAVPLPGVKNNPLPSCHYQHFHPCTCCSLFPCGGQMILDRGGAVMVRWPVAMVI